MILPSSPSNYSTIVFDCDGVILNSNKVKTDAFYFSTLSYGEEAAKAMICYHTANGGVSRYEKFDYFLESILHVKENEKKELKRRLLNSYSCYVRDRLLSCEVAPGLEALRACTSSARWLIVSGSDQSELQDVFSKRGIDHLFDGGIFGSPDDKFTILNREISNANIVFPALFVGDSKLDFEASRQSRLEFVYLYGWSEWTKGSEYGSMHGFPVLAYLQDLLEF